MALGRTKLFLVVAIFFCLRFGEFLLAFAFLFKISVHTHFILDFLLCQIKN